MSPTHRPPFDTRLGDLDTFAEGPPHELFSRMRDEAPVIWTDAPVGWPDVDQPGFWSVTQAGHVEAVSRDSATYSSWLGGFAMRSTEVGSLEVARAAMIGKDGIEHSRMRGTVNKAFTPRQTRQLGGGIRRLVVRLLDAALEAGSCDIATDVAGPLANETMAELLGVPEADRPQLSRWAEAFLAADDEIAGGVRGEEAMAACAEYLMGLLLDRAVHPADDLITALGSATYEGERMPAEDQVGVFVQLVAAGIDSTKNTVCNGILTLLDHPDQLSLLRQDHSLVPGAVEEILRWRPPFTHQRRTAACNTVLGGQPIAAGDSVVMWLSSSSRDPRAIERADVFDVTRSARRCPHHAFGGGGRHFCLGAGLARVELITFFEELVARVGDIRLTGPAARIRSCFVDGYKRVPAQLSPAPDHQLVPSLPAPSKEM